MLDCLNMVTPLVLQIPADLRKQFLTKNVSLILERCIVRGRIVQLISLLVLTFAVF